MKILTLDTRVKEEEAADLRSKRIQEEQRSKEWEEFKQTLWYTRVMEILNEEVRKADRLSSLPNLRNVGDLSELGSLVAVQRKVVAHLEVIRQRFLHG